MSAEKITQLLESARNGALKDDRELALKAIELADIVLRQANAGMTGAEKSQAEKLSRMMVDPNGKAFTLAMADMVFRPPTDKRKAEVFRELVKGYGVPEYLSGIEKLMLKMGVKFSEPFPGLVMPQVIRQLRAESDKVILPSEDNKLKPHLRKRRKAGMRMNLNQLGEAILGEEEAAHRLEAVINRLKSEDCDYISVKISAIFSQINLLDFEGTVAQIQERLRKLYRVAIASATVQPDGSKTPKFVNLDMEEYRDLHLTSEAFKRTLMEPEFLKLPAGIVLQAYLPDSNQEMIRLTEWAKERVAKGGAPIKIRIVKGANLAMEKVEAALHDWPQAPYYTKEEVDANYKRMLHYGCRRENTAAVKLGMASHNLFDLCYVVLLREREGVAGDVELEMLEGMANHQARVIRDLADGLLLYAPVVSANDFPSAIAYLVRRLDENTSEENFLHDLFGMTPGSKEWESQKQRFIKACAERDAARDCPNRLQDRTKDVYELRLDEPFENSLDTDWALRQNQAWIAAEVAKLRDSLDPQNPFAIPGDDAGQKIWGAGRDPSAPEVPVYKYVLSSGEAVEACIAKAVQAQPGWSAKSRAERRKLLKQAGVEIERRRGEVIAAMVLDAGKTPAEADGEVSEAIDFANYYADSFEGPEWFDGTEATPVGTVLVTPPWNFPFAIPCGGVLAALMAGNTVIIKPAPETVFAAWKLVNILWDAGIPKDALQFICTQDNEVGLSLVTDPRINAVILTGAWDTARFFLSKKPDMKLFAETSGKNALVITATADPDLAVKDLVKSAFGHSGQKCSAASLALIEAEVYDNPSFRKQLRDAAASLKVAPAWDPACIVTTIIREPSDALKRALTTLDAGEEWLLQPRQVGPNLWSPGIKLGVKPDSWYRRNECFGPVLGLIRVNSLEEAIRIQNDSDFGLTGGIHSLNDAEIALWKEKVEVGNAYINRPITGAIVRRQPFGGWKKSCFGYGAKAGGPNYLGQFVSWKEKELPSMLQTPGDSIRALLEKACQLLPESAGRLRAAAGSQARWWKSEFGVDHDPSAIQGETNTFRYRPVKAVLMRAETGVVSDSDLVIAMMAAITAGVTLVISLPEARAWMGEIRHDRIQVVEETREQLLQRLPKVVKDYGFLRYPGADKEVATVASENSIILLDMPVLANARIELTRYFREQAVSETTHRYGNIIPKPQPR